MLAGDSIRELLAGGRSGDLAAHLASIAPDERLAVCKPMVTQARAILSASSGSTVASWLRDLREDYPGGREQFFDAWRGRLGPGHWDAATTVLLASKTPAQAAKVWPIPEDRAFAQWVYPTLFPEALLSFVEQWSADFASNPKNWDRNRGRSVMYDWIEDGLVETPQHDGAVLMLISGWVARPGAPLMHWLLARPTVTREIFARLFTTPGVKGASLAQVDQTEDGEPLRTVVVPGLVKSGVWSRDFVVESARSAARSDLSAYQRRWFVQLAADMAILPVIDGELAGSSTSAAAP